MDDKRDETLQTVYGFLKRQRKVLTDAIRHGFADRHLDELRNLTRSMCDAVGPLCASRVESEAPDAEDAAEAVRETQYVHIGEGGR